MAGHRRSAVGSYIEPARPRQITTKPQNRREAADGQFALARTDLQRCAIAFDYVRGALALLRNHDPAAAAVLARDLWSELFAAGDRALGALLQPQQRRAS